MTDSEKQTRAHIDLVAAYLTLIISNLLTRAVMHDASKLQEPELSGYAGLSEAVGGLTYGTQEYKEALAPFREIIRHHYAHNPHHPEHWHLGVSDMSLLDILEMLTDWKAANDRSGGDFGHSIQVSVNRFGISEQLHAVLINTARELNWL